MKFSRDVRPCCGHSIETSYDGYCTLLTCHCICRTHCEHLQVTVPGEARRDNRLNDEPLYGWCRHCRLLVDEAHIRKLRPQRDRRMAIYWLGEADDSEEELRSITEHAHLELEPTGTTDVASQLPLFALTS
ncbi:MAG: hypothetical protein AABO58_10885 [Acidobacteriota bacterium]